MNSKLLILDFIGRILCYGTWIYVAIILVDGMTNWFNTVHSIMLMDKAR